MPLHGVHRRRRVHLPEVVWGGGIETVDEILSKDPNAAGLAINWQIFGSNEQEKADYSRGVLERFTKRAPKNFGEPKNKNEAYGGNTYVKHVSNPRRINFVGNAHYANYFEGCYAVDENSAHAKINGHNSPVVAEKMVINHYHTKSREEYSTKRSRGYIADLSPTHYTREQFESHDRNEEFDDGILKYRDERAKNYQPPDNSHVNERLLTALMKNLLPTLKPTTSQDFYRGKMETFLTCRAVCDYLKAKLIDDAPAKFFEEASLVAALKSVAGMSLAEARLLIRELPNLLSLPYPVVKDLRGVCLQIIPQLMEIMHLNGIWRDYAELDYIRDLLKLESDKL